MRDAFYDDGQVTFYQGDVRDVLQALPSESVQMCVTSPLPTVKGHAQQPQFLTGEFDQMANQWGSTTFDDTCQIGQCEVVHV